MRLTVSCKSRAGLVGAKRLLASILIFLLVLPGAFAQTSEDEDQPDGDAPLPYSPEEFPTWARDLRRGEIVALGAFPIALILTNVSYRLGRFTVESIQRGEFATEYAPAFVSPEQRAPQTDEEQLTLLLTSGVLSVAVALADYLLGRRERE